MIGFLIFIIILHGYFLLRNRIVYLEGTRIINELFQMRQNNILTHKEFALSVESMSYEYMLYMQPFTFHWDVEDFIVKEDSSEKQSSIDTIA